MNFSYMERYLDSLPDRGIPGVDCVIYHKRRQVFRHSAGHSNLAANTPVAPGTLYYLYSATKLVTCTAALQLLEQGKFLLTDQVQAYLPEFQNVLVAAGSGAPTRPRGPIRIGNLFTMTAGLTYELDTPAIRAARAQTGGACPTRQMVAAMAKTPLCCEPGTNWNYSLCHDVLGALVEVVSGLRFGEYLKKHIFEPAGMRDTGFTLPEEKMRRLAVQYRYNPDTRRAEEVAQKCLFTLGPAYESGGAGLISSVEDYILFADALCNRGLAATGERLLSPDTVDLMRQNFLNEAQRADLCRMTGPGMGYGLGVSMVLDRTAAGTIAAQGAFGWGGAAGAQVLIDPERALTLFYAQHMLNNMEAFTHPRTQNILYACLEGC